MSRTSLVLVISALLGTSAAAQTPGGAATHPPAALPAPLTSPEAAGTATNADPLEATNRQLFAIFQAIDRAVLRPAAMGYTRIMPKPIRTGLHNAFSNLSEPVVFLNDLLQVRLKAAGTTAGRFAMNSTVGLAGFLDPATPAGLAHHDNGFGNTLGRMGTPSGPYLFIPILGPSDVRDLIGSGLDVLSSPFTWLNYSVRWEVNTGRTVVGGLDSRANAEPQLKQVESMSTDTYATIRSLYLQSRQAEVTGEQVNVNALPDFGDQPPGPADPAKVTPDAARAPAGGRASPSADAPTAPTREPDAPTSAAPPPPRSIGGTGPDPRAVPDASATSLQP